MTFWLFCMNVFLACWHAKMLPCHKKLIVSHECTVHTDLCACGCSENGRATMHRVCAVCFAFFISYFGALATFLSSGPSRFIDVFAGSIVSTGNNDSMRSLFELLFLGCTRFPSNRTAVTSRRELIILRFT